MFTCGHLVQIFARMTHHIQALETRRHFVVSAYVLMPGPLSNAAVPTAFVTGDASADTINVTGSLAPAGSAYKYNFAVKGCRIVRSMPTTYGYTGTAATTSSS